MTAYFMDTSALVKRYVQETGSAWISSLASAKNGNLIMIAELAIVELFSVVGRRRRFNQLSQADSQQIQTNILIDIEQQYITVLFDRAIVRAARDLVDRHPLRALDAIQLSTALRGQTEIGQPLAFLSADTNLLTAAVSEGFLTDNPLHHP